MSVNYSLGQNRYLSVKKLDGDLHVTIGEKDTDLKTIPFPSRRWAQFVAIIGQVDETVNNLLAKQYVQLNQHMESVTYR